MSRLLISHWRSALLAALGVVFAVYLIVGITIGRDVQRVVARAQARHGGGPVEALLAVARSTQAPLPERNHVVWALGQLGASEALPVLETLVTGGECDHDSAVCQHEVEKAMALCAGAANPSAAVWRYGDLAPVRAHERQKRRGSPRQPRHHPDLAITIALTVAPASELHRGRREAAHQGRRRLVAEAAQQAKEEEVQLAAGLEGDAGDGRRVAPQVAAPGSPDRHAGRVLEAQHPPLDVLRQHQRPLLAGPPGDLEERLEPLVLVERETERRSRSRRVGMLKLQPLLPLPRVQTRSMAVNAKRLAVVHCSMSSGATSRKKRRVPSTRR